MCKICGLPQDARICDECFLKEKENSNTIIVDSTNNGRTILRRVKDPKGVLKKLRQIFNCCGKATGDEVVLHGEFSERIRSLIQSSPSFFCFLG